MKLKKEKNANLSIYRGKSPWGLVYPCDQLCGKLTFCMDKGQCTTLAALAVHSSFFPRTGWTGVYHNLCVEKSFRSIEW